MSYIQTSLGNDAETEFYAEPEDEGTLLQEALGADPLSSRPLAQERSLALTLAHKDRYIYTHA